MVVQDQSKEDIKGAILKVAGVTEITRRSTGSPINPAPGDLCVEPYGKDKPVLIQKCKLEKGGGMRKITMVFYLLLFMFSAEAFAKSERIKTDNLVITYENISSEMAQKFAEQAEKGFRDITAYLSKKYRQGRIYIYVSDKHDIPRATKDNEVLIPANRIRGDAGGPPPEIAGRGPAIVHELTHVIAPSRGLSLIHI